MSAAVPLRFLRILDIPADQMTSTVVMLLLEVCHQMREQIQALRDENTQLKGQKPKPLIKPVSAGRRSNGEAAKAPAEPARQA